MKKLGIGVQTLSKFREDDLIYVDKTKIIYDVITLSDYYFLSRPRRFGKSLLVNTIKEIFEGNKELFEETWIYDKWDFEQTNPVINLEFSGMDYKNLGLEKALERELDKIARKFNISFKNSTTYQEKFLELVETLGKEKRVVILIDEYDKPIIDFLDKDKRHIAEENRQILKNLYSGLKKSDEFIRLLFITGVSKFARVSIFSELNNLEDITMVEKYSQIAGYTTEEIFDNYGSYLNQIKDKYGLENDFFVHTLQQWYDGYSWDAKNFLYNPFSILNLCSSQAFNNYWFKSGTPTFLTKLIRSKNINVSAYDDSFLVSEYGLDSYDIENIDIPTLLFQTGYLTLKERIIDPNDFSSTFRLAYPNKEVRDSFYHYLIGEYTGFDRTHFYEFTSRIKESLEQNDIEEFILNLKALYASIPYDIFINNLEAYYHTVVYLILRLLGLRISVEVETARGRLDAIVKTDKYIYVMEFKMGTADQALKQIEDRKYYEPYQNEVQQLILMGIAFDEDVKNIHEYLVKDGSKL